MVVPGNPERRNLAAAKAPEYLQRLQGTLGADPFEKTAASPEPPVESRKSESKRRLAEPVLPRETT